MIKKIILLALLFFFSSCKINKIDKNLVSLNVSLKGVPLEENGFLMGISTLHSFSNEQVPTSIQLKLPKGVYHLGHTMFHNYFYLSEDENLTSDKEGFIHHAVGDLKSLESKVFRKILQRWVSKLDIESFEAFWKIKKEITSELTQLLSDPALDKEFVRIQKKDLEYAEKNAANSYLYNHEHEWDETSRSLIYKKKFTPTQRKKLKDFIKTSNLNNEELFINGYHYRKFLQSYVYDHKEIDFLNRLDLIDKTFKSQMIKDYFFFNEAFLEISTWNASSKDHAKNYQAYQKKAKNPYFKNYIKYLYEKEDQIPSFNYEEVNGKKVNLSDLKGNYIYIYIFYTPSEAYSIENYFIIWKNSFKKETSYLKKLSEEYQNKPIKFVGISMDLDRKINNSKDNWKKIIKKEKLDEISIQLIADKGSKSDFIKHFTFFDSHRPQFILLDKEGKIIERKAPRFSNSTEIKELLDNLK